MKKTVTGGHFLLHELHRRGIRRVFGVPGRENAHILFKEVEGLEFVTTRVEFNAGIMAEFSGRLTRQPQVAFCTMGPGATNMVTAAAAAQLSASPLLIISAQVESDNRYYNVTHQCVDQRAVFEPVTKLSLELDRVEQLPHALDRAFRELMTEPLGPVHISIPTDLFSSELSIELHSEPIALQSTWPERHAAESALSHMHTQLVSAEYPICIVGHEAVRAGATDAIAKLCESWNIPLLAAANCKGILPDAHPLTLGSASPYMEGILQYERALDDIFEEADLILTIGFQYVDDILPNMWTRGRAKKVIHISAFSAAAIQVVYNPSLEVLGHINDTLKRFAQFAPDPKKDRTLSQLKLKYDECYNQSSTSETLTPTEVIRTVNKHLNDGYLVTDIGYYRHHAILFSQPSCAERFFTDSGLSSFGTGLPSAAAAQFHAPDKPVFLLCGDGGFHSGSCDLETLKRHRLPVVVVVMNNSGFELIERYQQRGGRGMNPDVVRFGTVDFVKLAEANGIRGVLAKSSAELDEIIASRDVSEPLVIEVPLAYHGSEVFRESF